jgi:hypothetical protein
MGATFSPKIALECFHAPAGWIFFTAKAVGLFLLSQCIKYFSNEHPLVIQKKLSHLNAKNHEDVDLKPPQSRAPPQISLFE